MTKQEKEEAKHMQAMQDALDKLRQVVDEAKFSGLLVNDGGCYNFKGLHFNVHRRYKNNRVKLIGEIA